MSRLSARSEDVFIARRLTPALLLLLSVLISAVPLLAQSDQPKVTVGGGMRTSFAHSEPDTGQASDKFLFDSGRLYVNGTVTDQIKFMFNTEYDGATNKVGVLDAAARFEPSPKFNIWAGRFLPPSDRANLYGPYYAHHWAVYTDGVQNGHPFIFQGRDNGVVYWGDFAKKVKVSVGAFDGATATGNPDVLGAARVQIDFWDEESGYYLNGTYYGDKNLLAIAGATQYQSGHTATTADFLMERKLPGGGVVSIESEYSNYNGLGGYDSRYGKSQGAYALASYLFPKEVGPGKFEVLGKYGKAGFTRGTTASYHQKTTELNFNYVIKQFNARIMTFYKDTRFNRIKTDFWQAGVGLQIQM
jgi:hypothetical protein